MCRSSRSWSRREATYVGRLQISRGYAFFVSLNKELRQDVFIPEDKTMGATGHDKVVVRITDWDRKSKNPRGEVIEYPRVRPAITLRRCTPSSLSSASL